MPQRAGDPLAPPLGYRRATRAAFAPTMYAPFFGLAQEPFSIAPDPRFLFMSEAHREALAHLLYGVAGGGGFVVLTGEIGAGKTTVCRCFLEQVPPNCHVAYIFNPKLTVGELLKSVCDEFGIAVPAAATTVKEFVDPLNAFLLAEHAAGRNCVLVIDEAQALAPAVLEQLRLLTNLETAERKLLQIILIGQPELRELLARPELEQLEQRVIARYHLGALSRDETRQYVRHRLAVAGPGGRMPFEPRALARLHALTGGVPRRINLLAGRALLGAYAAERTSVDRRVVEQAAREVFGRPALPPAQIGMRAFGLGLLAAAAVAALVAGWALQRDRAGARPLAAAEPAASAASAGGAVANTGAAVAAAGAVAAEAASAQASGPVAVPAAGIATDAASVAQDDPAPLLAAATASEPQAWRELALRWNVSIGEGDPCVAVLRARLVCYRRTAGGLPAVRQLDRPGILTLERDGASVHAVLVAVDERSATLEAGGARFELTLAALARAWRGAFATFWRAPPGWRDGVDALGVPETRGWIELRLGELGHADRGLPLRERLRTFQLTHGLPPDGLAGPLTLMQLNRASGVDEPRLAAGA